MLAVTPGQKIICRQDSDETAANDLTATTTIPKLTTLQPRETQRRQQKYPTTALYGPGLRPCRAACTRCQLQIYPIDRQSGDFGADLSTSAIISSRRFASGIRRNALYSRQPSSELTARCSHLCTPRHSARSTTPPNTICSYTRSRKLSTESLREAAPPVVNLTKNACIGSRGRAKSFTSRIQRPSVRSRRLSKPGGSAMRSLPTTEIVGFPALWQNCRGRQLIKSST